MEKLINELIEKVKTQYDSWEFYVVRNWTTSKMFKEAEKIDQIQKYYFWFTEDSFDRLYYVFLKINSPETKIKKLLQSSNILKDLYEECFCSMNEPSNTLYWGGIQELFIIYCNEVLEKEVM